VDAARGILERDGLDGLTMRAVADAVGVRAPSLYKHVADRGELVRLVMDATVQELGERLRGAPNASAETRLRWLADEFRAFAHAHPVAFGLLFASVPDPWRADPSANAEAVRPVIDATTELVGSAHALDAARTLTAACVGFITMELAGAFRLGGSVDGAWGYLVETLVTGLARPSTGHAARATVRSSRR
jgi:AcrR family transcriptional regulator